jgi:hypothetical protein
VLQQHAGDSSGASDSTEGGSSTSLANDEIPVQRIKMKNKAALNDAIFQPPNAKPPAAGKRKPAPSFKDVATEKLKLLFFKIEGSHCFEQKLP